VDGIGRRSRPTLGAKGVGGRVMGVGESEVGGCEGGGREGKGVHVFGSLQANSKSFQLHKQLTLSTDSRKIDLISNHTLKIYEGRRNK